MGWENRKGHVDGKRGSPFCSDGGDDGGGGRQENKRTPL